VFENTNEEINAKMPKFKRLDISINILRRILYTERIKSFLKMIFLEILLLYG